MAKTRKKLEQHPIAKLFPAPDAAALDTLRNRIFHVGKQNDRCIGHARQIGGQSSFAIPADTEYEQTAIQRLPKG